MRIFQVDTFTAERYSGNPATVVLDADALTDSDLSAIAREFAHAETAFVSAAAAPDHDVRVRFFSSRKESPFVGHATIAVHAVLMATGRRGAGVCRQLSGTGILEVTADAGLIEFRQSVPELDAPLPLATALRVAGALRLNGERLHSGRPARVGRKGSTRLLLPVADASALDTLAPDFDALIALGRELGADGFFAFAVDGDVRAPCTHSRMFCPALGIDEDPVSGNAHSMLAAYLWTHGLISSATAAFVGYQGRQMGRPGEVSVRLEHTQGTLGAVRIGGAAVLVSSGELIL